MVGVVGPPPSLCLTPPKSPCMLFWGGGMTLFDDEVRAHMDRSLGQPNLTTEQLPPVQPLPG